MVLDAAFQELAQKPGAVVNLTVKEYRQAKPVLQGDKEVLVIPVHDHKTQGKGPANVTSEDEGVKILRTYHNIIRSFCDTQKQMPLFFDTRMVSARFPKPTTTTRNLATLRSGYPNSHPSTKNRFYSVNTELQCFRGHPPHHAHGAQPAYPTDLLPSETTCRIRPPAA